MDRTEWAEVRPPPLGPDPGQNPFLNTLATPLILLPVVITPSMSARDSRMAKKAATKKAAAIPPRPVTRPAPAWTFLTNHTHVLLCLYGHPEIRLREVALMVGITERMVQKIVSELVEAGYLMIEKQGRCNTYRIKTQLRLRHPLESHQTIGELLNLLTSRS